MNFTYYNLTYDTYDSSTAFPFHAYTAIQQAVVISEFCGIFSNGTFALVLCAGICSCTVRAVCSRLCLLFAILTTHIILLIFISLYKYLYWGYLATANKTLCLFIANIPYCLEVAAILTCTLLACKVFMDVYVPRTSIGRKNVLFWILTTACAWVLGFGIILIVVVSAGINDDLCMALNVPPYVLFILSMVTVVIPYLCSIVVTGVTLRIQSKRNTTTRNVVEPPGEQDRFQTKMDEPGTEDITVVNSDRKKSLTPWIVFNGVVVFFGFLIRVIFHLSNQESLIRHAFSDLAANIIFRQASYLGYIVFLATFPFMCLIITEVRDVFKKRCCKIVIRILCCCCRCFCADNVDDD